MKRLIATGSLAVLLLLILASCGKAPSANISTGGSTPLPASNQTVTVPPAGSANIVGTQAGNTAPDLQLTDMTGKAVSLADYRGQIVWLNFWATW